MLVKLIGKNVLYKLKLSEEKNGNYWITNNEGKKLINIVEKNNEWVIFSSEQVKIIKTEAINSFNISKIISDSNNILNEVILKENRIYYISLKNSPNSLFLLICEPIYEKNFIHLKYPNFTQITIGNSAECDIFYDNPLKPD